MVTSREVASDKIHSDKLQQRENSNTGFHESIPNKKGSPLSALPGKELVKPQQRQSPYCETLASQSSEEGSALHIMSEKAPNNLQLRQNHDSGIHASQSNKKGSPLSIIAEKELDNLHQRPSPDSGIHSSQSNQEASSLSMIPVKELDNLQQRQSPDTGICAPESNQEGRILSIMPVKLSDNLQQKQGFDTMVPASQLDQKKFTLSIRPEKVLDKLPLRRNPDIGVHALQSDQEVKSPSIIPDKPSEDGYNWRKYGQKFVRGNKFIRSYYKCTFPNCAAKKQVERSHDGHITDIKYLRKHEHPKPQRSPQIAAGFVLPIQARRPDEPSLTVSEDESSDVHGDTSHHIKPTETPQPSTVAASDDVVEGATSHSNKIRDEVDNDGDPESKKQKRDISSVDDTLVNKMNGEPRLVVETRSEVDIVNDGFRWRKYGQKLVKGNPNPRSYYRCSTTGCPVKKHVERASHDPKVVITTYEGQHDHNMPAGRIVSHNTGGVDTSTTTTSSLNGESRSEPEEREATCMDLVVHVSTTERETAAVELV